MTVPNADTPAQPPAHPVTSFINAAMRPFPDGVTPTQPPAHPPTLTTNAAESSSAIANIPAEEPRTRPARPPTPPTCHWLTPTPPPSPQYT